MEFSMPRDRSGRPCPPTHPSLSPPALERLREHPEGGLAEVPGLQERPAEVPGPRGPRGLRHALDTVLALTACAVLAGATSVPAVSEWIADAPPHIPQRLALFTSTSMRPYWSMAAATRRCRWGPPLLSECGESPHCLAVMTIGVGFCRCSTAGFRLAVGPARERRLSEVLGHLVPA
ncbi:transposase family protein [Streptomyces sp. NPDC000658]|uniref:transposase family protein n=1 Tax=Streptomyces sp. NPDC000658 TaxID=3154266 RepID=UPI0033223C6A